MRRLFRILGKSPICYQIKKVFSLVQESRIERISLTLRKSYKGIPFQDDLQLKQSLVLAGFSKFLPGNEGSCDSD